jgi:hypothetical protein
VGLVLAITGGLLVGALATVPYLKGLALMLAFTFGAFFWVVARAMCALKQTTTASAASGVSREAHGCCRQRTLCGISSLQSMLVFAYASSQEIGVPRSMEPTIALKAARVVSTSCSVTGNARLASSMSANASISARSTLIG